MATSDSPVNLPPPGARFQSVDESVHERVRQPVNPTGLRAILPSTVVVGMVLAIYGVLALTHAAGSGIVAPALVLMVVGLVLVATYMEKITGAPASLEEQFDEHTLAEDDPHDHGSLTPHDLPLDSPSRAEALPRGAG